MKSFLLSFLLLSAVPLFAFEWPVNTIILTATFCESRGDHFHTGLDIGGGKQIITPISPGEIIFAYEKDEDYTSVPVGLGDFCVLQHQGGIRSLYSHLEKNSMDRDRIRFNHDEPLGKIGDTGHSYGRHLHLSIIDSEMNTIINPLLVLPPVKDSQPPVIKHIYLRDGENLREIRSGEIVGQGETELLVELYDLREDVPFIWKFAPYKIFLYKDGKEISNIIFDSLHENMSRAPAGILEGDISGKQVPLRGSIEIALVHTDLVYREVYESEWIYRLGIVTFVPGKTNLLVISSDFAGNEISEEIFLTVSE